MTLSRRNFLKYSLYSGIYTQFGGSMLPLLQSSSATVKVLGIMQDGGLPQLGDNCERCTLAISDPSAIRYVTSLGLITPGKKTYLFDATPDIKEQITLLNKGLVRSTTNSRKPVDGIFLTHAHIGHYTGLTHLGFESISSDRVSVYCTERMKNYLTDNGPWGQLITKDNIVLNPMDYNAEVELEKNVHVKAIQVPHRQEYTDTVGFIIKGPQKSLLYLPDIDKWTDWGNKTEEILSSVDYVLVDGSFYSGAELPGRDMSKIKHPPISVSIERFKNQRQLSGTKIYFTHFNHTNPVLNVDDRIRRVIENAGFFYAEQGMEFTI